MLMSMSKMNENETIESEVFYLTTERQGLYIGNKLIKTVDEVQGKIKQLELFERLINE